MAPPPPDSLAASLDFDFDQLLAESGVEPPVTAPRGVELVRRCDDERSYLFALNHTTQEVALAVAGHDLVGDADTGGNLVIGPGGVAVVREAR